MEPKEIRWALKVVCKCGECVAATMLNRDDTSTSKDFYRLMANKVSDGGKIELARPDTEDITVKNCICSTQGYYWKKRCELAEGFIKESPCDPDNTSEQIKAYQEWQDFVNQEPK